jgi:hypothetical protein
MKGWAGKLRPERKPSRPYANTRFSLRIRVWIFYFAKFKENTSFKRGLIVYSAYNYSPLVYRPGHY